MNKIIIVSLFFCAHITAMETSEPLAINPTNRTQIISLTEALIRKTYNFDGTKPSDLFSFPDYQDSSKVYRAPFATLGQTVNDILNLSLPKESQLEKKIKAVGQRHPFRSDAGKSEYLAAFNTMCEEDIYHLSIDNFKNFYDQIDLDPFSTNDRTRNLSQLKENRKLFFESLQTNDVTKFNECKDLILSKKPTPSLLSHINKVILLTQKKGQPIIDSPENSDDDNLPEYSEEQKNDVSEIIARLQQLNHGR